MSDSVDRRARRTSREDRRSVGALEGACPGRRSYGSVVEAPLVSGGLPHVLTPGSLKRSLLRVRLGSAFASRSFRPIEMSSQRRMRGAVHAVAQNEAHSNCHRRRQEQAPVGFQHGPAPTAHSGLWPKKGVRGEGLVRLEVDERNFAGPIAPLLPGCRSCNGRMRLCAVDGGNRSRPFPRCGGG
jgi:hypothetical protein